MKDSLVTYRDLSGMGMSVADLESMFATMEDGCKAGIDALAYLP